jgi:hypothetical protein
MITKKCCRCDIEKDFSEFNNSKRNKDGKSGVCKICENIRGKQYRTENSEKETKRRKIRYYKDVEKNNEKSKLWNKNNSKKLFELRKLNIEKKREYDKRYRIINKEKRNEYKKMYSEKNREKINQYYTDRKKTDPLFKLSHLVRGRIYTFLKLRNIKKSIKTFDIVGCSPEFLREHLEKQFTKEMSWNLIGRHIHIDHIIPLSSATTEEEIYNLCHYTNLQPLWAKDNLVKGNKLPHIYNEI